MKSLIKFLSLSLLITAPIICMDGERKQSQAELDAIQLAKEQETKKIGEQQNKTKIQVQNQKIRNGLKDILKDVIIKSKKLNTDLIDRLPSDVQKQIVTMAYTRGFKDGYQLIPAITSASVEIHKNRKIKTDDFRYCHQFRFKMEMRPREKHYDLFEKIDDFYTQKLDVKSGMIKEASYIKSRETISLSNIDLSSPKTKKNPPSEISGKIINGTLFLDRCEMRTILEQCSTEQMELIRSFWIKCHSFCECGSHNLIILDQKETEIFESLPQKIRYNLTSRYHIKTFKNRHKKSCCAKTTFAALAGAVAVATTWFINR